MMSKEFKALNLCREKIVDSIKQYLDLYFDEYTVGTLQEKGGTRRRISLDTPRGAFSIDFHFNSNGTTTIEDFGGPETFMEMKKNMAYFIKESCMINSSTNDTWFVVKNIDKENFDLIIELLIESDYFKCNIKNAQDTKTNVTLYKLKGIYDEELTITYYHTGTVQIQGKPLLLFNEAISMFSELLEIDEIPRCYNKLYKLNIDKDAVREKFKLYMPNSYNKFSPKLSRCLHQAVYYSLVDGDMFDYSSIPLTAFRALEGHIKYSLKEIGEITSKDRRISSFYKKNDLKVFELKDEIRSKINNKHKSNALEEAYNKYCDLRHILSHWDDLQEENECDTTTMIDNIDVARTYILDTIRVIDSYYIL